MPVDSKTKLFSCLHLFLHEVQPKGLPPSFASFRLQTVLCAYSIKFPYISKISTALANLTMWVLLFGSFSQENYIIKIILHITFVDPMFYDSC
jgi:hypothetical protein